MGEMVKDPNCAYCVEGELLAKFGYPCCEMKTGKPVSYTHLTLPTNSLV